MEPNYIKKLFVVISEFKIELHILYFYLLNMTTLPMNYRYTE